MAATRLGGRAVRDALMEELAAELATFDPPPKLVFVRANDDAASESYVRGKARLAERVGIESETIVPPADVSQRELERLVVDLSADPGVDGILVQLPLHPGLDPTPILNAIDPDKDVDGLHPVSVGRLWSGASGLFPATPTGLIAICDHYGVEIEGRRVVIVGRSNLVGKPSAALFLRRHGTVTLAHSRTRDLSDLTRRADILVSAVGRPGLITPSMVAPGATVLDVGLTRVDGEIRGDVDPDVADVAGALTPMPGGTGVVTVAMVVRNTVSAARRRRAASPEA